MRKNGSSSGSWWGAFAFAKPDSKEIIFYVMGKALYWQANRLIHTAFSTFSAPTLADDAQVFLGWGEETQVESSFIRSDSGRSGYLVSDLRTKKR